MSGAPVIIRTDIDERLIARSQVRGADRNHRLLPPFVILLSLVTVTAGLLPAASARAAGQLRGMLAVRPMPVDQAGAGRPRTLLMMAANAAQFQAYSGRQRVTVLDGNRSRSMDVRVQHTPGSGSLLWLPTGEGERVTEVFQPDDATAASIMPLDSRIIDLLSRNYTPVLAGRGTVAGRSAQILQLRGASGRVAAVLWLDEVTCLPLRREVYDDRGRLTRSSVFQQVRFGDSPPAPVANLPVSAARIDEPGKPSGRPLTAVQVRRLGSQGWVTPSAFPRGLDLVDGRLSGHGSDQVLHLTYSDGLSTLSIFEQVGRLDTSKLRGWNRERRGGTQVWSWERAPLTVTWSGKGRVFTVVSDDADRLDRVIAHLPHGSHHPGVAARIRSGAHRVLSWLNPFG